MAGLVTATMQPVTKHPAKFSPELLDAIGRKLTAEARRVCGRRDTDTWRPLEVLDPMAGVGRIHDLQKPTANGRPPLIQTTGVELQRGWAACRERTICADFLRWAYLPGNFHRYDAIATSPTYGNRYSDHHDAQDGSTRRSYQHDYGEPLDPANSGLLPWGPKYWEFHAEFYRACLHVLRPHGLLLLNVSDFYKGKALVAATEWHRGAAMGAGFRHGGRTLYIATPRLNGHGAADTAARAEHEVIHQLRAPTWED